MSDRILHCWAEGPKFLDGCDQCRLSQDPRGPMEHSTTCFLPDGHGGEHEWTDDRAVSINFGGAE